MQEWTLRCVDECPAVSGIDRVDNYSLFARPGRQGRQGCRARAGADPSENRETKLQK